MNYNDLSKLLRGDTQLSQSIMLGFAGCSIQVSSNQRGLLDELENYFSGYLTQPGPPAISLELIEAPVTDSPLPMKHWPRPADKGPKETFTDVEDARLIGKFRTGLLFLQGVDRGIALGPLQKNINQVINFINNQTISYWKRAGWEICHASALMGEQGLVAFAGFSGGGKSTLMLHLMNAGEYTFVSNDRLLVKRIDDHVEARGVAKMPRVNPGTLLNNPALVNVLPRQRQEALKTLSTDELWALEEKYDAPMTEIFGAERIAEHGNLSAVVILDWHRETDEPTSLEPCSLDEQRHLLDALMKSPGPFQADATGHFTTGHEQLDAAPYLENLHDTAVFKLTGKTDFAAGVQLCKSLLES